MIVSSFHCLGQQQLTCPGHLALLALLLLQQGSSNCDPTNAP
jgi:hypothetical protein